MEKNFLNPEKSEKSVWKKKKILKKVFFGKKKRNEVITWDEYYKLQLSQILVFQTHMTQVKAGDVSNMTAVSDAQCGDWRSEGFPFRWRWMLRLIDTLCL